MLRAGTDRVNFASRSRSDIERLYPQETVLLSTAVTILETPSQSPTGWSPRRFFQRRGNVTITDARIVIAANPLSPIAVLWLVVVSYGGYRLLVDADPIGAALVLVGSLFLFQRRPYRRDLPYNSIRGVIFGSVRGMAARCDIISVVIDGRAIQLVTAQSIPAEVRRRLETIGNVDAANPAAG